MLTGTWIGNEAACLKTSANGRFTPRSICQVGGGGPRSPFPAAAAYQLGVRVRVQNSLWRDSQGKDPWGENLLMF